MKSSKNNLAQVSELTGFEISLRNKFRITNSCTDHSDLWFRFRITNYCNPRFISGNINAGKTEEILKNNFLSHW